MSEANAPISGRVIGTIEAEDVANGGMIVRTGGTTFTVGSEVDVYLGHEERLTREEWEALARPARPDPEDMSAEECEAELEAAEGVAVGIRPTAGERGVEIALCICSELICCDSFINNKIRGEDDRELALRHAVRALRAHLAKQEAQA